MLLSWTAVNPMIVQCETKIRVVPKQALNFPDNPRVLSDQELPGRMSDLNSATRGLVSQLQTPSASAYRGPQQDS